MGRWHLGRKTRKALSKCSPFNHEKFNVEKETLMLNPWAIAQSLYLKFYLPEMSKFTIKHL